MSTIIKIAIVVALFLILVYIYTKLSPSVKSNTPCPKYALTDTNVDNSCLERLWASAGCPNKIDMPSIGTWWRTQTLDNVIKDMNSWANGSSDKHRSLCYGPDKTKWPK